MNQIPLDTEEDKTVSIELPSNAADIFAKLSPEDVKRIINEVSASVFGKLQVVVLANLFLLLNFFFWSFIFL